MCESKWRKNTIPNSNHKLSSRNLPVLVFSMSVNAKIFYMKAKKCEHDESSLCERENIQCKCGDNLGECESGLCKRERSLHNCERSLYECEKTVWVNERTICANARAVLVNVRAVCLNARTSLRTINARALHVNARSGCKYVAAHNITECRLCPCESI